MDNIIISSAQIYFPKPSETLSAPPDNIPTFAIRETTDGRCCLLIYTRDAWDVLFLPKFEHPGKAIMAAVRFGK
ncbi:hypothetical protein [Klebsiella aerogenes]|uniref:hypothetical protein n=1 Tax=Klebsiella aerogenes TaxID=548 RepID=UPI00351D3C39